jgi:hypothetical protein
MILFPFPALVGARYAFLDNCIISESLPFVFPPQYLKENLDALKVKLTPEDLAEVRATAEAADACHGSRYPAVFGYSLFLDTPELSE